MDGLAVRSVAYFMEERPVAFQWQNGDVLPGHLRATSPCACNVTRAATPHFSGASVSVHPALRVGISGAEMIGQEHIRNVPVFGEVLSGCRA